MQQPDFEVLPKKKMTTKPKVKKVFQLVETLPPKPVVEVTPMIAEVTPVVEVTVPMVEEDLKPMVEEEKIDPKDYSLVDISQITQLPSDYPEEFKQFCLENDLKLPDITKGRGIALSLMLTYKNVYWNRETCDEIFQKFNIAITDSIQSFNKHDQMGIKTNNSCGTKKGRLYIVYPYALSNKHKMRKDFKFDGNEEEKNIEIEKIKSTIKADYVDVDNSLWQLGHKNPDSVDNSKDNLVLQPPIQGKYRDNYIFIDTLTKIPVPKKLETMINKQEIEFTHEQILAYKAIFDRLAASSSSSSISTST